MNLKKKEKTDALTQTVLEKNELAGQNEETEITIEDKKKPKKKKKPFNAKTLKKYFNQKTFLGIGLAGLVLLVVVYVFVYLDYSQKTEELQLSNTELKKTVNELQMYYDTMSTYQEEIEEIRTAIQEIMEAYPVDSREEDVIMLAVQLQEENAIAYDAVNMEEAEEVYSVPAENVTLASIEGFDDALSFRKKRAVYVNTTNYDNLKSIIEQVFASDNRIGIDKIVYAKDEENGTLEGTMDLYFYSAAGTGKAYVAPDIAAYLAGTDDIFQSGKVAAKSTAGEDTENEGDAAEEDGADENDKTKKEDETE